MQKPRPAGFFALYTCQRPQALAPARFFAPATKANENAPAQPLHPDLELQGSKPDPTMPFVVTENCIKCKHTDCVEVCPVDCFHEGPNFLVIDPDECIDCTLCEPECPVNAIFPEDDVPAGQEGYAALNAELAKAWPVLTVRKDPPADAGEWDGKPDKLKLLER